MMSILIDGSTFFGVISWNSLNRVKIGRKGGKWQQLVDCVLCRSHPTNQPRTKITQDKFGKSSAERINRANLISSQALVLLYSNWDEMGKNPFLVSHTSFLPLLLSFVWGKIKLVSCFCLLSYPRYIFMTQKKPENRFHDHMHILYIAHRLIKP